MKGKEANQFCFGTYMEKIVKCLQAGLFLLKNVHTFHKKCPQFLAREKEKFTFYNNNSHIKPI